MTSSPGLARFQVLAAAILFSTGGAAIKASDLGGWEVAGWRAGIAVVFLLLAAPSARRGWSWRTLPVAFTFGATLFLFVLANKLTTAANTVFLQSTSPLYLLLLSPLLLRERLGRREVVMLALITVGMAFFLLGTEPAQSTAPYPARGNWLAAAVGLSWALTVAGLRWLSRSVSERQGDPADKLGGYSSGGSMPAVVLGNALIFAVCLPRMLPGSGIDLKNAALVGFLGVVQVGVAYMFLTAAMRRVAAFEASLLLVVEPVLSPVWSWLVHGEVVTVWALSGGGMILAATALPGVYEALRRSPSEVP